MQGGRAETEEAGAEAVNRGLEKGQQAFDEDDVTEPPVPVRGKQLHEGLEPIFEKTIFLKRYKNDTMMLKVTFAKRIRK